jgi:hypothetical protein
MATVKGHVPLGPLHGGAFDRKPAARTGGHTEAYFQGGKFMLSYVNNLNLTKVIMWTITNPIDFQFFTISTPR